jgi:putative transposase
MATFRRSVVPGATYFFTVNTYQRLRVLTDSPFYGALKNALQQVKTEHPFTIDAFVLLPNHLHCIWTLPPGDANYALRWNFTKRLVSQATRQFVEPPINNSRQQRRELGLWQRRFWEHQIRDEQDFIKHVEYIHWNPVKHGYVIRVKDWPYSSFHRYVRQGLYPLDWASVDEATATAEGDYGEPQSE